MKYLSFLVALTSSAVFAGQFDTTDKDLGGLSAYISIFQKANIEGNIEWFLRNDPRYVAASEFYNISVDTMISNQLENYSGKFPETTVDSGKINCSMKYGEVIIVLVDHAVTQKSLVSKAQNIYIKSENRWWVTGNENIKLALDPFRDNMSPGLENEQQRTEASENLCFTKLAF